MHSHLFEGEIEIEEMVYTWKVWEKKNLTFNICIVFGYFEYFILFYFWGKYLNFIN
jgi:hypothetical protein